MSCQSPIVVALDFEEKEAALHLIEQLNPDQCRLKVGKEMFTRFGPQFIDILHKKQFDVFLDLKFYDIPNTVAKAVKAAADLGVWMVNVHASGGSKMMMAAKDILENYQQKPLLIAVTVLTSMEQQDLKEQGINTSVTEHVIKLAELTQKSGLDGVVCSANEARILKSKFGKQFKLITPGIRPDDTQNHDQKRVMTPQAALDAGVDYLVIGRPITQANDPANSLQKIYNTIYNK